MAIKPYIIQRRMMRLGKVRLGEKGSKGEPKKLTTLRFTSASKALLDAIAEKHGGTVRPWEGAPDSGYFEVTSETSQIDIILPPVFSATDGTPTAPYSQFFEAWSAGGCVRRCDGETEALSGKPCMCDPEARECKITTRVSFMLPDIPGLGVWELESHGYNAAVELPGTLEVLLLAAAEHKFIPAVLRIEQRTKKVPGEGTRRFIVPVIELPHVTVRQLASGDVPLAINAPPPRVVERPALPAAPAPSNGEFENGRSPEFGAPPQLPVLDSSVQGAASDPIPAGGQDAVADDQAPGTEAPVPAPKLASEARKKKLNVLVGTLRDAGHITNEQLWRAMGRDPQPGTDGELHWSPLRDSLTNDEASQLIDRLSKLEERVKPSAFQIPESAAQ